jgi:hypothetical protein
MKATRQLHDLGQGLWLDNITRTLLDDGTLAHYIAEDSITGLTSNPSIFDAAIGGGDAVVHRAHRVVTPVPRCAWASVIAGASFGLADRRTGDGVLLPHR